MPCKALRCSAVVVDPSPDRYPASTADSGAPLPAGIGKGGRPVSFRTPADTPTLSPPADLGPDPRIDPE
jgi:hypothetical protein